MIDILKDRHRQGQMLAILFLLGAAASLYQVYSLPSNLSLSTAYQAAFMPLYITLGITFLLGGLTLYVLLLTRKEVIVYRDKVLDASTSGNDAHQGGSQTTISLEGVKEAIRKATNRTEILQAGLQSICKQLEAGQGAVYLVKEDEGRRKVELTSGYALNLAESTVLRFEFGEGLIGQAAASGQTLYLDEVPDGYIKILSGLGSASPRYLLIVPLRHNASTVGVIELATFKTILEDQRKFVEESAQLMADKI